jgi:hypothetical protein
MRIPKAPSWRTVFLFSAAWNLLITHCLWGLSICLGLWIITPAMGRLDARLFPPRKFR